jgi:hypothetical protein
MLWVTWRQHRGLLTSVAAVCGAAVAAMLLLGTKIHQDYAALMACHPAGSPACQGISNYFDSTDWHEGSAVLISVLAAPVLLSMFAGPPVLAREFENSTYRYAWTQGTGRVRWTAAKLAIIGAVATAAALVISALFTWFFGPFLTTQDMTEYSPSAFGTRVLSYAAWTLTAVCLGTFAGALVRRVLPAMAVTVTAYSALAALTWLWLRDHYPVTTFWPMQLFEAGWLLILSAVLIAATIGLVRRRVA